MDDEDLFSEARVASLLVGRRSWKTPPRATARQTIRMLTEDGAYMAGFGGMLGRIEPGYQADLAAFSLDFTRGVYLDPDMPLIDAMVSRARGADVRMTMVAGRVLYKDGQFPHLDIEAKERSDRLAFAPRRPFSRRPARSVIQRC